VSDAPTLKAEDLAAALDVRRIGRSILSVAESTSTNDLCWQRLTEAGMDADGFVALADHQSAGRGRLGRRWLAPRASSILLSALIIQPAESLLNERLSLIAGIAACLASRSVSDAEILLRWPNDLICKGKKIGGVLVESRRQPDGRLAAVLGIGINCLQHAGHFPPELRGAAASLDMVSPHAIDRFALAVALIQQLDDWLSGPQLASPDRVRREWLHLAEPLGKRVRIIEGARRWVGTTVEMDPAGGLVVQLDSGGRRLFDPATTTMEALEDNPSP